MRLLVTGGAGYVGAAVARALREAGHSLVVVDDLSTGRRGNTRDEELVVADVGDAAALSPLLECGRIDGIVHLAASCLVGESMQRPGPYYLNNVAKPLVLLDLACRNGVRFFVFSSSAAVYGEPERLPLEEDHPLLPTNPYGETKLAFERALLWHGREHGLTSVCLRYFNAAGATLDGRLGEQHDPETHLVPNVLRAAHDGIPVPIFGTDFPTPDGTAIRDYVHIEDLAAAHLLAIEKPPAGGEQAVYNLGTSAGFSVRQVIETARKVTRRPVPVREEPRRAGDPARLYASSQRARRQLGWTPRYPELDQIVASAWDFVRRTRGEPR